MSGLKINTRSVRKDFKSSWFCELDRNCLQIQMQIKKVFFIKKKTNILKIGVLKTDVPGWKSPGYRTRPDGSFIILHWFPYMGNRNFFKGRRTWSCDPDVCFPPLPFSRSGFEVKWGKERERPEWDYDMKEWRKRWREASVKTSEKKQWEWSDRVRGEGRYEKWEVKEGTRERGKKE